jgi:hypothetical protein
MRAAFHSSLNQQPTRSLTAAVRDMAKSFEASEQALSYWLMNLGLIDPA